MHFVFCPGYGILNFLLSLTFKDFHRKEGHVILNTVVVKCSTRKHKELIQTVFLP